MKKLIVFALTACLIVTLFSGCGMGRIDNNGTVQTPYVSPDILPDLEDGNVTDKDGIIDNDATDGNNGVTNGTGTNGGTGMGNVTGTGTGNSANSAVGTDNGTGTNGGSTGATTGITTGSGAVNP